jgi:regulator of ribonuclease activity A
MDWSTADLMDERGDELDACEIQFRDYGGSRRFEGRIRTVRCPQDNVLLKTILATPGAGRVLVVDGGGSYRTALMGDVVARSAVEHGWAGVVIYGCVRDTAELGRLPIGIKALGSNPRRSAKLGAGEVDVPVTFGGATFTPGADLHSDEDGIVVTRPAAARNGRIQGRPPSRA